MYLRSIQRAIFFSVLLTVTSGYVFGKEHSLRCILHTPGPAEMSHRSVAGLLTSRGLAFFRPFEINFDTETLRGSAVQGTYGIVELTNDRLLLSGVRDGFRAKDGFSIDRATGVIIWIVGEPSNPASLAYGICETPDRKRF